MTEIPEHPDDALVARLLRRLRGAIRVPVSFFPGRTRTLTLLPDRELLVKEGRFVSTGNDPCFLVANPQRVPGGWVEFSLSGEADDGVLTPELYYDLGEGFSAQHCVVFGPATGGETHQIVRLPFARLKRLRLDPTNVPTEFKIHGCSVKRLGHIGLLARVLSLALSAEHRGNILESLRTRGLRDWRRRVVDRYIAGPRDTYQLWIAQYDTPSDADVEAITDDSARLAARPLISVIMPVYNTEERWLRRAIDSVRKQIYERWELCIADDASPSPHVRRVLSEFASKDPRIKVQYRETNGHISAASNTALELASGELVAFLDHDDELAPHALYMVARARHDHPDARLLYSDEDKIDDQGLRCDPYFKPDWNPDLFLSHNLVTHLATYERERVLEIGGFREGFEGAQDYDLALRYCEGLQDAEIVHIPHVLYHWRAIPGSTAAGPAEKDYAAEAGRRAVNARFERTGSAAVAELVSGRGTTFRIKHPLPDERPLVSIIIPTRDQVGLLKRCVESLVEGTDYEPYELLIVDNLSRERRTLEYLQSLEESGRARILRYRKPFNFAAINNFAALRAQGSILCFLNNDTEIVEGQWLGEMVSHAVRPEVGAVGAKLLYPNDTIQHGGVILGIGGFAGHAHKGLSRDSPGYVCRALVTQNMSAVTGACLVLEKELFDAVGGLDEERFAVACNDVDLCLRLREAGYHNVWTPFAVLYHHESVSRGYEDTPEKKARFEKEVSEFREAWGDVMENDPAYNPNLSLQTEDFALAWPPRVRRPWKPPDHQ